jgi:hypothetical protein
LLATKLHRPPTPTKHVHRPRLSQRLDEGLALKRQITLVSAPERIIGTFEYEGLPETGQVSLDTTRFEALPGKRGHASLNV